MRERYQKGSVQLQTKASGQKVWVYRYRDYMPDGSFTRRKVQIGTVQQFPNKASAWKKCDSCRATINEVRRDHTEFGKVLDRYIKEEMPKRFSTQHAYDCYIANYIRPEWGKKDISAVKALAVEHWLKKLDLAPKTKGHIKGIMSVVFACAIRWELVSGNPMSAVRVKGGSRRREKPRSLSYAEFEKLLAELPDEPIRTMVLAAMCLGLRVSELFALKWSDFDFENLTVSIQRSIVRGRVDDVKTEASQAPVPLDADLAEVFKAWRRKTEFFRDTDWVFASPKKAGFKPYLSQSIHQRIIQPAAKRAGLGENIGWHTFRHSYRTWLNSVGADMQVQKELMRHADYRTTMNTYGSAMDTPKREANSKVVKMALRSA